MKINANPLNLFGLFEKPKVKTSFPPNFALIKVSRQASERGIFDDENKFVEIYKNYKKQGPAEPYSSQLAQSLEEVDEIAVIEETFEEETFDFEKEEGFGFTEFRK